MNIQGISKTSSAMKCYHGLNLYRELDSVRNNSSKAKEYLRCSSIETWEYMVQCQTTAQMRLKFIIEICKELKSE